MNKEVMMAWIVGLWKEYKSFVENYYKEHPQEIIDYDKEYSFESFIMWIETKKLR